MWNVFQKNKSDKEAGDIILRTNFAFSKAISVGQIIMAHTFSKLKELKNIDREAELDITDTQIAQFSKEISKLLLFWLTRDIWTYLVEDETDAKKANVLLFLRFKERYGVEHSDITEYAKAAGTSEEVQIFGKNVAKIFDCYGAIEILELNTIPVEHLEEFAENTKNAFSLPIAKIQESLK